jgi:alpha-tubulin suppressor-like RCC1 family protein
VVAAGLAVVAAMMSSISPAQAAVARPTSPAQGWTAKSWGKLLPEGVSESVKVTIPNIVQLANSAADTYALTSSGQVYAWGLGVDGALGNGSTADSVNTPVLVNLPVTIAALANPAPYKTMMAVGTDGSVWGWGLNEYDLLCTTTQNILTPIQLPLSGVTSVTGQGAHALYNEGGTLFECGKGAGGALGDGSLANTATPVQVNLPGPVSAVVSSWEGSGALLADGTYYDWGYNAAGQLGDGTTANSDVPVQVNLPAPVAEVYQGGDYGGDGSTMALLTNGKVYAWGANNFGQLDYPTKTNHLLPVRVPLAGATEVACGGSTCYAIVNGLLEGFGANPSGELINNGKPASYIATTSNNQGILP